MSAQEEVDAILRRAGLAIADSQEYQRLVNNYPLEQERIAQLRIPEVRYGEPDMVFRARPTAGQS
ncbi:MAG: hypothetical protein JOZ81_04050 [Chloroflexi bacterium]|nr:hypothetical protein [Chloroflexota bacterium]